MKVGDYFYTHEELKQKVKEYEEQNAVKFYVRQSLKLDNAKAPYRCSQAPRVLKFYEVLYSCIFGGKKFISKSHGQRRKGSVQRDCKARIDIRLSKDSSRLEVKFLSNDHNHEPPPKELLSVENKYKKRTKYKREYQCKLVIQKPIRSKNHTKDLEREVALIKSSLNSPRKRLNEEFVTPDLPMDTSMPEVDTDPEVMSSTLDVSSTSITSSTKDAEDDYASFVASQMRRIGEEDREKLRIEIQTLILKYRFKK